MTPSTSGSRTQRHSRLDEGFVSCSRGRTSTSPTVSYAVTIAGHDGIPDGGWSYAFFFPLDPFENGHPSFSSHPRVEVVCRAYEKLVGTGPVIDHILDFVMDRESGRYGKTPDFKEISFKCTETDARFERWHHLSDNLRYKVELVLRVEETESSEVGFPYERDGKPGFFRLTPFTKDLANL